MSNSSVTDQANSLIRVNRDAESGFHSAAEGVRNSELETLFTGYASRHAQLVMELGDEVKRLGDDPADAGTLGGALNQGWLGIKSALSGHSASRMLACVETASCLPNPPISTPGR